jgi:hypothetical protein
MLVTFTAGAGDTVTVHVPLIPLPSCAVAVMVALPAAMAVTVPVVLFTDTIPDGDTVHVTFWLMAVAGSTLAVTLPVAPPTVSERGDGVEVKVMLVTFVLSIWGGQPENTAISNSDAGTKNSFFMMLNINLMVI